MDRFCHPYWPLCSGRFFGSKSGFFFQSLVFQALHNSHKGWQNYSVILFYCNIFALFKKAFCNIAIFFALFRSFYITIIYTFLATFNTLSRPRKSKICWKSGFLWKFFLEITRFHWATTSVYVYVCLENFFGLLKEIYLVKITL